MDAKDGTRQTCDHLHPHLVDTTSILGHEYWSVMNQSVMYMQLHYIAIASWYVYHSLVSYNYTILLQGIAIFNSYIDIEVDNTSMDSCKTVASYFNI